ncbi:MAG: hypothetical protein IJJ84_01415 [Kiritimatiellae bacterium]|nr:hypothetical protein [Kiritimatiellia bacterium]
MGTASLPCLGLGYYRVKSGEAETTFAVVPVPECRMFDKDSFYGIDTAQSWLAQKGAFRCPWNGSDTYRTISDLIWRVGLPHVRDRLRWSEVNPKPGVLDFRHYMYNADLLCARGILVSGMFHDSPQWAGRLEKLPSDLAAIHAFCARVAATFGNRMGNWEFWNEQDIGFAPEPAWDYAAALKAAYLGFKAGRPGIAVLPGALCRMPVTSYMHAMYENDAAKYGDVFNYHIYSPVVNYPAIFAKLREFMALYGIADRAIWITECGTDLEGHSSSEGASKGNMAHSQDQEMVVAEFYPKSQIALQMEGVARNYFFVFCAYNERNGEKDWGVMRRDGTVKPVYAAISAMTCELVSARLVGEMQVGKGLRAYLFTQPDGTQTVAFWSVSPLDTSKGGQVSAKDTCARLFAIPAANGNYRLTDMCGSRSQVTVTNGALELESTRFPAYVSGLRCLSASRLALPRGKVRPYVLAADEDLAVILRIELNTNDFKVASEKTKAILCAQTGRMNVQVWNLGDSVKTGCVEVAGGRLRGLPEDSIKLGPFGTPPATFHCNVVVPDDPGVFTLDLVLSGTFNGKRISRLSVPIWLEDKVISTCKRIPLAWNNLESWTRNTSAQSYKVSWDEAEQAIRFDLEWESGVDRWFYPTYKLSLPQESLSGAQMVAFEVKSAQDKVENDFKGSYLMPISGKKGKMLPYLSYPPPLGSWEMRHVELPGDGSMDEVKAIRLGANPNGMKCSFWVRNISILRKNRSARAERAPAPPGGRAVP